MSVTTPDSTLSIEVLFFSVLRERLGMSHTSVQIQNGARVSDLMDRLMDEFPELREFRGVLRIGRNAFYADESETLSEGDEIALITPVSGG